MGLEVRPTGRASAHRPGYQAPVLQVNPDSLRLGPARLGSGISRRAGRLQLNQTQENFLVPGFNIAWPTRPGKRNMGDWAGPKNPNMTTHTRVPL